MVILISYDLVATADRPANYEKVRTTIETHAASAIKPLYSQWLVETEEPVETWTQRLLQVVGEQERLFVVQVRKPYQGWLSQPVWEWLRSRVV